VPFARKAWRDLQHFDDGAVCFDHDHYLKIWAPHSTEDRIRLPAPGRGPGHQPRRRTGLPGPARARTARHGR
jgi:hypothetical protein